MPKLGFGVLRCRATYCRFRDSGLVLRDKDSGFRANVLFGLGLGIQNRDSGNNEETMESRSGLDKGPIERHPHEGLEGICTQRLMLLGLRFNDNFDWGCKRTRWKSHTARSKLRMKLQGAVKAQLESETPSPEP